MKSLLVTFHASHNHGSALQAFATQNLLDTFHYDNTILNFQMPSQKKYYSLYGGRGGMKLRELAMIPQHFQRRRRQERFRDFQAKYFNMTPEVNSYDQLKKLDLTRFDLMVSGADQIWSNQIPEFRQSNVDYTGVYFGDFINTRKIAFGSSTGEASVEYLKSKQELLKQYEHIAVREEAGKVKLEQFLNSKCDVVLDPTLLLSKEQYSKAFHLDSPLVDGKYIFLYTLQGVKIGKKWRSMLEELHAKTGYKIIVVSPFFPINGKHIININDAGPIEYVNLIKYAQIVLTDSFHGTAFSSIFRKQFFVFQKPESQDPRKKNLLKQFGLQGRIFDQKDADVILNSPDIDYAMHESNIQEAVKHSRMILERYLNE
ncbi:polysaccharide pyruvyl transferase family protein [Lactiplantibacillus plantarum]|uniref:polysaccharide pyruvyl transferase family protein n=1 Tax=Lactiplantibacillus TaxID=2767842 RepID=UPI0021A4914D|nr:polysaccharide pyruvyl transferase family protein [Lactiplantibacillus pentosus]